LQPIPQRFRGVCVLQVGEGGISRADPEQAYDANKSPPVPHQTHRMKSRVNGAAQGNLLPLQDPAVTVW
jgi:hypothetical protein